MGVRDPGFRILTYEMSVTQRYVHSHAHQAFLTGYREELYRHGGLFSVTSKILVNDFLSKLSSQVGGVLALMYASEGTVPAKLITGLVILHAERSAADHNTKDRKLILMLQGIPWESRGVRRPPVSPRESGKRIFRIS